MLNIVPYESAHWLGIEEAHDAARMQELRLAGLEAAFLPLVVAAEREDLFEYQLFVAKEGDTVAGFVAFTEDELAWLYVHPDHQRKGIGRELATFAMSKMTAESKYVEVMVGNEPARKLYRTLGFTREKPIYGHMPGNEEFEVSVWQMETE